ncbi:phage tail terminator family protein [Candidatus Agathobaculum pullicola]|uniref:phage tail terminator family protein n=1 Tax=Candidatus Agathobaculum pullicola TaxID=2838426 RepID=UPI003F91D5E3
MLTIKEIMDEINAILMRLYPDRTVYTDVLPEQFERPSFFLCPAGRKITSRTAAVVEVEQKVTVQCIDEVGDRYETQTARLYDVTETLTAAFLQRGALHCGDRKLTADRVDVSRSRDITDVTITVTYEDDRPAAPITQSLITNVAFGAQPNQTKEE